MGRRGAIGLLGMGLVGVGLYALRRHIIARLLKLPPARYRVGVDRDVRVPMPDGVGLLADRHFPRADGSFPTILIRSYYGRSWRAGGPWGLAFDWLARRFAERGYQVLIQTTRGRFGSEGETAPFVDAAPDGRATLDWIARQPWFDGNLGLWGQSYLGYVQWSVAADAPAFLKALAPSITTSQFSSVAHADGAFGLDTALRWIYLVETMDSEKTRSRWAVLRDLAPDRTSRRLTPAFHHLPLAEADAVALGYPVDYYREWLAHSPEDEAYWGAIDHSADVARVTAPVHLTSGWYDFLLRELLADYEVLKAAGRRPYLTIGPWTHGAPAGILETLRDGLIWFDAVLKGDRRRLREKPVRLYVMGADEWREMESWPPPAQETRYFLHGDGRLSSDRPDADSPPDHFRYDPTDPTPAVGGPLFMDPSGPVDNRALEARPDVLCYTTPPLASDLEVVGRVLLELYVRSSLAHTDFFGRLCDVYPDGRSINVCDGLFRLEPGKGQPGPDGVLYINLDLWATAYRFQRGHCLRLQVSSGAHPRWSRNLGTGERIGDGTTMMAAEQTIYHSRAFPSALVLPVTH